MEETSGGESVGLLSALKNIAATLLAGGKTRLELFANEVEVEKLRAIQLVLMAQGVVFCFGVGILLAVGLLVALFWEQRLAVLGILTVVFIALGGVFLARFKQMSRRPDKIFAASLAELEEDMRQLKAMTAHEPPAR